MVEINIKNLNNEVKQQLMDLLSDSSADLQQLIQGKIDILSEIGAQMFINEINGVDNTDNVYAVKAIVLNTTMVSRLRAKTLLEDLSVVIVNATKSALNGLIASISSQLIKNLATSKN